ncbi:hypothetical protein [Halomonas sp. BM-2019]|uniref:hypothetical protein n=1 Tax=Halomonas sp. BM-2019 TaxID=2811227 RepID=UPI001B3C4B93|nr:MAG: hypothetical protein J5F18_12645 [Halomonas sp. BM-2019]
MLKRLFGKRPVHCWPIKQIDDQVLHLCPRSRVASDLKHDALLAALRQGRFSGGVRMGESGLVLNAQLFEALVPEEDLQQEEDGLVLWRGRRWRVAQVPQYSWTWTGGLVASPNPLGTGPQLVSREDISVIRRRADPRAAPPGPVVFRAEDALEDPTRDLRDAISRSQRSRAQFHYRDLVIREAKGIDWTPSSSRTAAPEPNGGAPRPSRRSEHA